MIHIRQKDLSIYTVVITTDWDKPLQEHPSIVEHPEFFEIVDEEIPSVIQYLNYIQLTNQ
jgi:hypothetical protein